MAGAFQQHLAYYLAHHHDWMLVFVPWSGFIATRGKTARRFPLAVAGVAVTTGHGLEVGLADDWLDRLDRRAGVVQHGDEAVPESVGRGPAHVGYAVDAFHEVVGIVVATAGNPLANTFVAGEIVSFLMSKKQVKTWNSSRKPVELR